ncbi:CCDC34 family protein [Nocardiopsis changdeensis]|uniref:Uncharacterized protein n=1 Tax=Nocardiopsis changdeensis TaxID=2831969 RepID=A0A975KUF8_9ACTN|nr:MULTISPECIES: CCDC34 family protein [Nocardiopsis]QUX26463.1 hypothetical protein KGD84_32715 [Nocardiopsis changdeensis]QYX40735.1 CCDC34 family protein [Nocardiopsis sp. MT53]
MNIIDTRIPGIVARSTSADAVAARRFLAVDQAHGRAEAMNTHSAARLIRRFRLRHCIGQVARAIIAAHTPERPYDVWYAQARERAYAAERSGELTAEETRQRLARIRNRRNERHAEWVAMDAREARADYRALDHAGRVTARLRFRADRPRT